MTKFTTEKAFPQDSFTTEDSYSDWLEEQAEEEEEEVGEEKRDSSYLVQNSYTHLTEYLAVLTLNYRELGIAHERKAYAAVEELRDLIDGLLRMGSLPTVSEVESTHSFKNDSELTVERVKMQSTYALATITLLIGTHSNGSRISGYNAIEKIREIVNEVITSIEV